MTALTLPAPFTGNDVFGVGRSDEARTIQTAQRKAFFDSRRGRALPPHMGMLSAEAQIEVDTRWGSDVCEGMFEFLASRFPDDLLRLVKSNFLAPPALTFAAEIAGRIADSDAVRATLTPLLHNENALVREGAIYGLRNHTNDTVIANLKGIADRDRSPGVRQAAADILDEP